MINPTSVLATRINNLKYEIKEVKEDVILIKDEINDQLQEFELSISKRIRSLEKAFASKIKETKSEIIDIC